MASFSLKDHRPYRLVLTEAGRHRFGGKPVHDGTLPKNTDTPLHLFLLLDLTDQNCPVTTDKPLRYLPLYYPLKCGSGGAQVQYAVVSDWEIDLLYMSESAPDPPEKQYIQVASLPSSQASIVPLEYEEARILGFLAATGYFQPGKEDMAVLERLDYSQLILVGRSYWNHPNDGDIVCRNRACKFYSRRVWFDPMATIPPISVNGTTDFWYEWDGAVDFVFGLCQYCGTVIAFNRAS
jgi:hypothetical protein